MNDDHPTIKIEEPAPGYLIITGHSPRALFVEGKGHIIPPDTCIIPAEIPTALLRAIADAREGKKPAADPVTTQTDGNGTKEGDSQGGGDDNPPALLERILKVLSEGNIQLGKLAERLGVTAEEIKALDGTGQEFHIAHAGWVKLGKKEGEAA